MTEAQSRNWLVARAITALLAVVVAVSFCILYTSWSQQQSDRQWCDLFVGLDDNYRSLPPGRLNAQQREFAEKIHNRRKSLHCPDTPAPAVPQPSGSPN